MRTLQIAIDGPAGAGKSTIAKHVANNLGIAYVDTGAMYRAVTLKAIRLGIDLADPNAFGFIATTRFAFDDGHLFMDGVDVSHDVRSNEVSNNVSLVSSHLPVREILVRRQQELANNHAVVMDGRDIGTKVLPNADFKFFLTASIEERAKRRLADNHARGIESDLGKLIQEITRRDRFDTTRQHSPLQAAHDATIIDTSHLQIEEVVQLITDHIKRG